MDTGRLKTIAILILLCVNLAFGGILISEKLGTAEGYAQQRSELKSVMANLGIDIAENRIPAGGVMLRRSVPRQHDAEEKLVKALLGDAAGQDQGGNIWYYENDNGWAWCRGGGSFEIMLKAGGGSLEDRLQAGGIRAKREADRYICYAGSEEVFNCRFTISQRSGSIYLSGRFLLGVPTEGEGVDCTDVATLLLRFCDLIREAGGVFSRVEEITGGYVLNVSVSGMELSPVWQMQTDGGVWYMDLSALRLVTVPA